MDQPVTLSWTGWLYCLEYALNQSHDELTRSFPEISSVPTIIRTNSIG